MEALDEKIEELKGLMETETGRLEELSALENRLQRSLLDKDWTELEGLVRNLQNLAQEISYIENSRNLLYAELQREFGLESGDGFYDFLAKLPMGTRIELSVLYRRLRLSVSDVRSVTGGIDAYVTATVSTMGKILEELFPSRKTKMYGRDGAALENAQPLVFSHCL